MNSTLASAAAAEPLRNAVIPTSLASRTVVTLLVSAGFLTLAWADATQLGRSLPAWWLLPVAVVLAIGATDEMLRLYATREILLPAWLMRLAVVLTLLAPALCLQAFSSNSSAFLSDASPLTALGWPAIAVTVSIGYLWIREIVSYSPHSRALERLSAGALIITMIGLPMAFMVSLRLLCLTGLDPADLIQGESVTPGKGLGIVPLLSLVAVVKAGDVAAYVVGSFCGRQRLAPLLSPGKTWEGASASLLGSIIAAWLVLAGLGFELSSRPWGGWLVFGVGVGLAGMFGDLAESLLKRELGAKDSGRSLGGLGGVLDLIDSLLFAAPVAWILWISGR